jgi:hypothetical protein
MGIHEFQSVAQSPDPLRFFMVRKRVYTGLLLFIILVGMPLLTVPFLRNRLSERIFVLKASITGYVKPAIAHVGANPEGFPKEYEMPAPVPPPIFPLASKGRTAYALIAPGLISLVPDKAPRRSRMPEAPHRIIQNGPPLEPKTQAAEVASEEPESEAQFQQGNGEKDAYNLLLRSDTAIAGLVRGSNPLLHFISWDASHKGDDVYLVRLRFQSEANPDVVYIWEVKLLTSEVTPLSYNAKSVN